MNKQEKKQLQIVLMIVVLVFAVGLFVSQNKIDFVVTHPDKYTILTDEDFTITYAEKTFTIGKVFEEELLSIFPNGKYLGMSTVYKIDNLNCYLNFTKKEGLLYKLDIASDKIPTSRGIIVGDSVDKITSIYGNDYTKVEESKNPNNFELIYGDNRYIVFKVKDNILNKIVIEQYIK